MSTNSVAEEQVDTACYLFYGSIQTNAAALLQDAKRTRASLSRTSQPAILDSVLPLQNRAALELFRAGHWADAHAVALDVLDLLERLPIGGRDEATVAARAAALLNLARLWASRGDFVQATIWFTALLALPIKRYEVVLPEVVRAANQTGLAGDALAFIEALSFVPEQAQPHFARARANLLFAGGQLGDARRLLDAVDRTVFSPIERCWLGLEKAAVLVALDDQEAARLVLAHTHQAIADLQIKLPPRSPVPLLLAIALADHETNTLGLEVGAHRLRATRDRARGLGLECLELRAATRLVTLVGASGSLCEWDLEVLRDLIEVSRYRIEVLEGWWALGRVFALSEEAVSAALGATYLGRLVAEDATHESPAARRLVDGARQMIDFHGIVAPLPSRCFFDDEPPVLAEMWRAVAVLGREARTVFGADV